MNILIVEDNPISAKVLENTLQNCGYETILARDGKQAIEQLEAHPEIAMVISDIMMPNTNGVELLKKLKQRPDWGEIPIIVCTSMKPEEIVTPSVAAEGWQYLFKPIKADALLQKVKEALGKQRPFLQNCDDTMSRLGMDASAFLDLLDDFLNIVVEKIELLEQRGTQEQIFEIHDLLEGAKLLGAERLVHVLDRVTRGAGVKKSATDEVIFSLLLRELRALRRYLTVYTETDPVQFQKKLKTAEELQKSSAASGTCFAPWQPDASKNL